MSHTEIRTCYPVTGNWYSLTHDVNDDRRWIDRVILWALVKVEEEVDHVKAITSNGLPHEHYYPGAADCDFVFGPDVSPIGKTWDEVYQEAIQNRMMLREVTHLFPATSAEEC